jgi:hypothetical protein
LYCTESGTSAAEAEHSFVTLTGPCGQRHLTVNRAQGRPCQTRRERLYTATTPFSRPASVHASTQQLQTWAFQRRPQVALGACKPAGHPEGLGPQRRKRQFSVMFAARM